MTDTTNSIDTATDALGLEPVSPVIVPTVVPVKEHDSSMDMWMNANFKGTKRRQVDVSHRLWYNNPRAASWIDVLSIEDKINVAHEGVVFFNNMRDVDASAPTIELDPSMAYRMADGTIVKLTADQLEDAADKLAENILAYKETKVPSPAEMKRIANRGEVIGYLNYFIREESDDGLIIVPVPGVCELRSNPARDNRAWNYFKALNDVHPGIGHDVDLTVKWCTPEKNVTGPSGPVPAFMQSK